MREALGLDRILRLMASTHKARGGESRPNQVDQRGNLAGRLLDAGEQPALVVGEHIGDRAFPFAVEEINPW